MPRDTSAQKTVMLCNLQMYCIMAIPPQVQSPYVPVHLRVCVSESRSWYTYRRNPTFLPALTVGNIRRGRFLSDTDHHVIYNHHYRPHEFLVRLISFQGLCPDLLCPSHTGFLLLLYRFICYSRRVNQFSQFPSNDASN